MTENNKSAASISSYISTQIGSIASDYQNGAYGSTSAQMTQNEQDSCRQFYLSVISEIYSKNQTKSGWIEARRQFDQVLEAAENTLKEQSEETDIKKEEIVLNVDGNLFSFQSDELKNKSIGRIPFTDMPFKNNVLNTVSRLHAIVHAFPSLGLIAIIDLGSAYGITMVERSNQEAPLTKSLPNDRRPLVIGINECAVFKMGSARVTINPKKCIICEDNYRNFVGACGHFICCQECADRWQQQGIGERKCPACNQTFFGPGAVQNAAHAITMLNNS